MCIRDSHMADAWVVGINSAKLQSLSQEQQDALTKAAEECQQWYVDYQASTDADMLKLLTDNGMQYNDLTEEGKAEFVAISQSLYDNFRTIVDDDALFDATLEFCGKA